MSEHERLVSEGLVLVQNAPQAFFDIDVESDGVPGYGSLLSLGGVSAWGETYYAELKPSSDAYIPTNRDFCEAHGLERDRLLAEGQYPAEAMIALHDWVQNVTNAHDKVGATFVGFNASYDFPWVDLALKQAGILKNPFGTAGYCIKSLAMALSGTYDWRDTAKGRLPAELVPPGDFTHNAHEDAPYQQKIHFALAAKLHGLLHREEP